MQLMKKQSVAVAEAQRRVEAIQLSVVAARPISLFLRSHLRPRIHKGSRSERGGASSGL